MRRIPAAKFKEQCLAILDDVDEEGIIITKRGKPVAKLTRIRAESSELIGSFPWPRDDFDARRPSEG